MAAGGYDQGADWDEGEDLELIDSDERLPWLEADEEEGDEGG